MTVIENDRTAQRDPAQLTWHATSPDEPVALSGPGPGAKSRIMATADRLFYLEGIRAVGVDRLISESSVTKATFYKHFGAKDTLITSYIQARHLAMREQLANIVNAAATNVGAATDVGASATDVGASATDVGASATNSAAIHAMVSFIVGQARSQNFRGCAFINAATEFPDSHHAVREVVSAHRDWYAAFVADLFRGLGHPMPGDAADEFVLMRDGAMSGGYASDPIAASAALERCVERLLREAR